MATKRTLVPLGLLAVFLTGSARGADPSFGSAAIATPPGVSAAAVADVNHDGASDLAVVNWALNEVTILIGDGTGRFKTGSSVKVGERPSAIAPADFNGDGAVDLAVANDQNLSILLGNGTGGFAAAPGSPVALGG